MTTLNFMNFTLGKLTIRFFSDFLHLSTFVLPVPLLAFWGPLFLLTFILLLLSVFVLPQAIFALLIFLAIPSSIWLFLLLEAVALLSVTLLGLVRLQVHLICAAHLVVVGLQAQQSFFILLEFATLPVLRVYATLAFLTLQALATSAFPPLIIAKLLVLAISIALTITVQPQALQVCVALLKASLPQDLLNATTLRGVISQRVLLAFIILTPTKVLTVLPLVFWAAHLDLEFDIFKLVSTIFVLLVYDDYQTLTAQFHQSSAESRFIIRFSCHNLNFALSPEF